MVVPYLITIACDLPAAPTLEERRRLQRIVADTVEAALAPIRIVCVESGEACRCCDQLAELCPCLIEHGRCLDHERRVPA